MGQFTVLGESALVHLDYVIFDVPFPSFQILHNKQFLLLTLVSGGGIAAFSVLSTVIQQLICPQGYDDVSIVS